jgi:MFS family permease
MKYLLHTSYTSFKESLKPLLLSRSFSVFIVSVLFSQIAFNMMYIGLIFRVFSLTSSSFAVSMLILTILLPQVILSFIGGIVADLRNKKHILLIGNVIRALMLIPLIGQSDSIIIVYLIALLVSVVTQFYVPAEAPLIPHLVEKKDLLVANSVFGISLFGSTLIGYVLAGPIIQMYSHTGVFIAIGSLYVLAGICAACIPGKPKFNGEEEYSAQLVRRSLRDEILSLYTLLRHTRIAGNSFFLLAFSQIVILILANLVPSYAEKVLKVPIEQLSLLIFAPAALGMIVSAFCIAILLRKYDKNRLMDIGVFMSGIVLISFPGISGIVDLTVVKFLNTLPYINITAKSLVPFFAGLAGFANALIFVPSQTVIQEIVSDSSRAKLFGLLYAIIGAVSLIPVIISGGVADVFGVQTVLLLIGCIIIVLGLIRLKYSYD